MGVSGSSKVIVKYGVVQSSSKVTRSSRGKGEVKRKGKDEDQDQERSQG